MHRFFLPEDSFNQSTVVITGKLVHQLRHVLRLKYGDRIVALDNKGNEYEVELQRLTGDGVEGKIVSKAIAAGEPKTRITLYQAPLKGSNFELVLQKCTEIGVAGFVPVMCERSVAGEPDGKRLGRWRSIIAEAAEQSGRGKLPALHNPVDFAAACKSATGSSFLLWEEEKARSISDFLKSRAKTENITGFNMFVGPEGGFSPHEAALAQSNGIVPVSLGRRILRAETAGLVAAAVTLYEFGDLNRDSAL